MGCAHIGEQKGAEQKASTQKGGLGGGGGGGVADTRTGKHCLIL